MLLILRDKLSGNSSWASYFEGMVETWQPPSTKASGDPGVRLFPWRLNLRVGESKYRTPTWTPIPTISQSKTPHFPIPPCVCSTYIGKLRTVQDILQTEPKSLRGRVRCEMQVKLSGRLGLEKTRDISCTMHLYVGRRYGMVCTYASVRSMFAQV